MTKLSYSLTRDGDTVTFKHARYVETFDTTYLGFFELYERIKYAAITAGLSLNEQTLERLLRELLD